VREFWQPELLKAYSYKNWSAPGRRELTDTLKDRVREILAKGTRNPLPPEMIKKLDEIMERAENAQ
jgi:trimethylamine:corrinoid methyltransferase-like protein